MQYAALPCLLIFTGIVFIVVFFVALVASGDALSSLLVALCSIPTIWFTLFLLPISLSLIFYRAAAWHRRFRQT